MPSAFGGIGRPTNEESDKRRREFIKLVAEGAPFDEAAMISGVKPIRALSILSDPQMRPLLQALPDAA